MHGQPVRARPEFARLPLIMVTATFRFDTALNDFLPRARPFSLCLHCNLPLRAVDKAGIIERLPESVRVRHDSCTTCDGCARLYWKGSHYQRMAALLASVSEAAHAPAGGRVAVELPDENDLPARA